MTSINQAIHQNKFKNDYQKVIINILYSSNQINNAHSVFLKQHDLTLPQYNVLRILRGQHPKPASVNLLIERMLDKNSNASRLVEKLRKKELVSRKPNEKDRRQVDICITQKGLKFLKKLDPEVNKLFENKSNFSQKEAKQLSNLLDKFRHNFNIS